jgi:hypothetical protein
MMSLKIHSKMFRKTYSNRLSVLSLLFCMMCMPVIAQSDQLQARRAAMEQAYQQDMAVCYQRFDVVSCRNEAREKRIATNAALRKDELAHNALERQRAADEAQRRADEKQREAQEKAVESAMRETSPNNERYPKSQPNFDNSQRAAYEQKQREAAERRSNIDKRLRERDKAPAAPLPIPEAAK